MAEGFSLVPGAQPVPGYKLVRPLGQGGFGEVWEALAPGNFAVALKFVRLENAKPELRALDLLRSLRHPHLLDVQWAVSVGHFLVVAMPLCDRSLADRLNECKARHLAGIPYTELLTYIHEAAEALDYLNHPRDDRDPIQHRDVKPHNLFLVGGAVRLADFGLAKILADSQSSITAMTPNYAPPEFFRDEFAATSDQYSLAVSYYQLRSGRLLFSGSIHKVMHGHLHEAPDLTAIAERERPAIARALAKNPQARWSSCKEFAQQLGQVIPRATGRGLALQHWLAEVRAKTITCLEWSRRGELLWSPAGTANHLTWHAGHALWVHDALVIQPWLGHSELPHGWSGMFKMGSKPKLHLGTWPTRHEIRQHLEQQLARLVEIFACVPEDSFDHLPPYPHPGDHRNLFSLFTHAIHDEANHQGEMYLLLKLQRSNSST